MPPDADTVTAGPEVQEMRQGTSVRVARRDYRGHLARYRDAWLPGRLVRRLPSGHFRGLVG
jgi:hypothetical protein